MAGRGELADVQRLNGRTGAVGREEVCRANRPARGAWARDGLAEVEEQARAAEDAAARAKHVVGGSGARRGLDAEERIVLEAAAERVEEAILEVAVDARAR